MAIISNNLRKKGKLNKDTIVATVMSNLGLNKYAKQNNLQLLQTKIQYLFSFSLQPLLLKNQRINFVQ